MIGLKVCGWQNARPNCEVIGMSRAKRRGRPYKARKSVSLAQIPLGGDHGTGTAAATRGTMVEPMKDENGKNPNSMGRRRRVSQIERLWKKELLTMRQIQAAQAIQDAHARADALSSGGEFKERVQASPKPDATISVQVDAISHLAHVMKPVRPRDRHIVDHICVQNRSAYELVRGGSAVRLFARFRKTLDDVADHLCY